MSPDRSRRQRGAVSLEFALVFPVALALLGMIIYLGLYATYSGLAEHGVRKAARFASIRSLASGEYPTTTAIQTVGAKVDALLGTPLTVQVKGRGGPGPLGTIECFLSGAGRRCRDGDIVTVTATYDAGALTAIGAALPFVPGGTITRTATARFE